MINEISPDLEARLDKFQRVVSAALVECELLTSTLIVLFENNNCVQAMVLDVATEKLPPIVEICRQYIRCASMKTVLEMHPSAEVVSERFTDITVFSKPSNS